MTQPKLYVLDDEIAMVRLLCEIAELTGFETSGNTDASGFFENVIDDKDPGILVLDLHMPEMDGVEVMRRLAELEFPPSVVLMSGHDIGVLHAAEKLGHAHDLEILAAYSKPVPMTAFRLLIEEQANRPTKFNGTTIPEDKFTHVALELRRAIRDRQLIAHYQPQVEIRGGRVAGVEALVRWDHPEHGLLFPGQFVPIAEQQNIVGDLTNHMLSIVLGQAKRWRDSGFPMSVSVNISSMDLVSLDLPEHIGSLLAANGIEPETLTLEMTESAMMGELVTSLDTLTRMRLKGVGLSIDDFGTGYSSLSQLHRIPFNELKIDQTFIAAINEDVEARAIVRTCILLGHELNMTVVAEGVETSEQLETLRDLGCDRAQGYLFSRPLPPDQLLEWVNAAR
jgi:EAL domain-containing protein (putative c-di-GMP-specific phosphodiesterase class I)/FixJ family two-component response regulator